MADTSPPAVGHMRLWSRVLPDLGAGQYDVSINQEIAGNDPGGRTVRIDVTGPRFSLPGPEIHSVFPPKNAQGSFSSRLPHIALKRRTLPWEREADPIQNDPNIPWLALVVIADYEGEFKRDQPIRDAFTSTTVADAIGAPAEGTCDYLETTSTVVGKVFPAAVELPLLTHVRQVNLEDAENLKGDKDGWMAVCISNRLPQPNTTYGAYLISLEGQLGELPEPGAVQTEVGNVYVYQQLAEELNDLRTKEVDARFVDDRSATREFSDEAQVAFAQINETHGATARSRSGASQWSVAEAGQNAGFADVAGNATGSTYIKSNSGSYGNNVFHLNDIPMGFFDEVARTLRFPVLAHWSFSTEGEADFQNLLTNIDVGMLSTQPTAGDADVDADDLVEVTETGHTQIDHTTRRGEESTAWYRGPFTPREVVRRVDPPPFFVSDQALSVGGDGRPDISEAAAFEIGRLLALSDAAFVELLVNWRRGGFQVARDAVVKEFDEGVFEAVRDELATGRLLRFGQLQGFNDSSGLIGPLVDPVRHAGQLDRRADIGVIARGLGVTTALVREAIRPGIALGGIAVGDIDRGGAQAFDEIVAEAPSQLRGIQHELGAEAFALAKQVETLEGDVPPIGRDRGGR